jgi:hypothetical protein
MPGGEPKDEGFAAQRRRPSLQPPVRGAQGRYGTGPILQCVPLIASANFACLSADASVWYFWRHSS